MTAFAQDAANTHHYDLTEAAVRSVREGDVRLGTELARKAYVEARDHGSPAGELRALNAMGICLAVNGQYIEAMAVSIDAFRLAEQLEDRIAATRALAMVASSSTFILDTAPVAMALLDHCLESAIGLADAGLQVHVRNARGVALLKQQRFDESAAEFRTVLAALPGADESLPPAVVVSNIAAVAMRKAGAAPAESRVALQGKAEAALAFALDFARREGNLEALSRVHYSRGALHAQRREYGAALDELDCALALADRIRHRYRAVAIRFESATIRAELGRCDEAVALFEAAYADAESGRPCKELQLAAQGLADALARRGDLERAAKARSLADRERREYESACAHARRDLELVSAICASPS